MLVKQVMSHPAICVDENTSINETIDIMRRKKLGFVPITKSDYLIGVVSDRDILLRGQHLEKNSKISTIMTNNIIYTVPENATLEEAGKIMSNSKVRRLVVVNNDLIRGVITTKDLLIDKNLIPYIQNTYTNIHY